MRKRITIIGSGLTGCFMAMLLVRRGYAVTIYEKNTQDDILNHASNRSFNLTFYGYAVDALKQIGLWTSVLPALIALEGSVTQVGKYTKPVSLSFRKDLMVYYTVQRARLLKIFIQEVSKNPDITFHFNSSVIAIDRKKKQLWIKTESTKYARVPYNVLFGTDGANSQVRAFLQNGQETKHTQSYAAWEYKQVVLSAIVVNKLSFRTNTQYVWIGTYATVIAFPTLNGYYTALCMLPKDQKHGFSSLTTESNIKSFITKNFPELLVASDVFVSDLMKNPRGSFITVSTTPWFYEDSITILGDAAHACLPFYGIGMSVGFGDCLRIDTLMDTYEDDWGKIFPLYQKQRKRNTDVIAALCKESLTRFRRHKLADYASIYNKVESILNTIFPRIFLPPLFYLVVADPDHADLLYKKHTRQRMIARIFGLSLMISIITIVVSVYEKVLHLFLQLDRNFNRREAN